MPAAGESRFDDSEWMVWLKPNPDTKRDLIRIWTPSYERNSSALATQWRRAFRRAASCIQRASKTEKPVLWEECSVR